VHPIYNCIKHNDYGVSMGYQDYISESEASILAGVSVATLSRFAETGYLHFESDSDGLRLISKAELSSLFGLDIEADKLELVNSDLIGSDDNEPVVKELKLASGSPVEEESVDNEKVTPKRENFEKKAAAIEALERETVKLKNILDIQEKILDLREEQIENLSKERDWLRSRVERTEEKIERDQLLLLSETQIIRGIMAVQHRRRSPLRATLEWLGLADPPQPPPARTGTIEIGS